METYSKAINLVEKILGLKIRKVRLLNMSKKELRQIRGLNQINEEFLDFFKGFYDPQTDSIYIVDGNETDLPTFVHEILHSNSQLHANNSPIWIFEGLTKALTQFILEQQVTLPIDYYLEKEKEFWLDKILKHRKAILQAYFSPTLEEAEYLLKKILKTTKNLSKLSYKR
ncbi:MAG: hypothetical protein ACTSRS_05465 [Candidatus Helarchaeota archaeon]